LTETDEEEYVPEEYTLEELKTMPRDEVYRYFLDRLTGLICKKVCPNEKKRTEWHCRGCLVRIIHDNGMFYYDMGWVTLLKQRILLLKTNYEAVITQVKFLHKNRFQPAYVSEKQVWVVEDVKTHIRFPEKSEKRARFLQSVCDRLNEEHDWDSKVVG